MRFTLFALIACALLTACASASTPPTLMLPTIGPHEFAPASPPEAGHITPDTARALAMASVVPQPSPSAASGPLAEVVPTPTITGALSPTLNANTRYRPAFGIDYAQPAIYLTAGDQTRLSDLAPLTALVDGVSGSVSGSDGYQLGEIYRWIRTSFTPWSAGGRTIGAVTTDQLFAERRLGGCHDWALVYASVARSLGYPAVLIDTASVVWMKQFAGNAKGPYVGHVFVEVYAAGKWMLVDSTNNWLVENDYDPSNPVIPLKGNVAGAGDEGYGFYVMRKGVDTWGYGVRNVAQLNQLMEETARQVKTETLTYPPYRFERLP